MQAESKPQGQQPQYQRPRIQARPSRPSVPSVSRRPSTRKPSTYLPAYKDANANSQAFKSKAAKGNKFAKLSSARSPIRSTTARPLAHLNRSQNGRLVGTQSASTAKTQLVRPNELQSPKQSTPRPARPRRPTSSRKGIPLFSNPAKTIFGAIRSTVKPQRQRQHARTQLPSRRKPQATPRGQLARRPKFDESFSEKRPSRPRDEVRNIQQKASLRYLPEEKKVEEKEEEKKYEDTEDTPKESNELQPEEDDTEQISDLDDLPGYIVTFRGPDEGANINQEDSSGENEELSVSHDETLRESEEEQHLREHFKEPEASFGLFKPSIQEITKTSGPDVEDENAEPESATAIFQPSNQDLTLPGFVPSVAVPKAPVNPAPVSVSSLPRPEPERGPSGFPKLKQGCCSIIQLSCSFLSSKTLSNRA